MLQFANDVQYAVVEQLRWKWEGWRWCAIEMEMGGGSGGGVQSISRVVLYRSLSRGYFYDNTSSNDVTVL